MATTSVSELQGHEILKIQTNTAEALSMISDKSTVQYTMSRMLGKT